MPWQWQILSDTNRPEIKDLKRTRLDNACEVAAAALLVVTWAVAVHYYSSLPNGTEDNSATVFVFPAVTTMIYFLLLGTNFVSPRLFNYPVQITAANARTQYTLARQMLSLLKVCVIAIFGYITWTDLADSRAQIPTVAGLPVALALIFVNIAIYLYRAKHAQ